ncbi:unnamed protein product, partial [Closterium sp. Naga37s-1]
EGDGEGAVEAAGAAASGETDEAIVKQCMRRWRQQWRLQGGREGGGGAGRAPPACSHPLAPTRACTLLAKAPPQEDHIEPSAHAGRDVISFSLTPSHSHSQSPSYPDSSSHSPNSLPFPPTSPPLPPPPHTPLPPFLEPSSFACNSLFGSWAGIPPSPLQDEAGHPINFSHVSAANQQLPPGEIKQVRRGLRLLRRSAACLAAAHAGRFGIARPGDEARGGGGAELDEVAELAMMMSAATRDTRSPFLRPPHLSSNNLFRSPFPFSLPLLLLTLPSLQQPGINLACDSSFLFTPPNLHHYSASPPGPSPSSSLSRCPLFLPLSCPFPFSLPFSSPALLSLQQPGI